MDLIVAGSLHSSLPCCRCLIERRWTNYFEQTFMDMSFSKEIQKMRQTLADESYGHGFGRHSEAEQWTVYTGDLMALADFLGK